VRKGIRERENTYLPSKISSYLFLRQGGIGLSFRGEKSREGTKKLVPKKNLEKESSASPRQKNLTRNGKKGAGRNQNEEGNALNSA